LKAAEAGESAKLQQLIADIETLTTLIETKSPQLDRLKGRLKILETSMDWAKQYLDYEKLIKRIDGFGGR
jgi:hypothetical protein